MRHSLRDEQALVVLDDVDLEREEVEALMNAAPASEFLSAATERRLWSGGRTIALRGLPPEEALALIERELGRSLGEEDRTIVGQLYAALEEIEYGDAITVRLFISAAIGEAPGRWQQATS
jgi:hypothetical protein